MKIQTLTLTYGLSPEFDEISLLIFGLRLMFVIYLFKDEQLELFDLAQFTD